MPPNKPLRQSPASNSIGGISLRCGICVGVDHDPSEPRNEAHHHGQHETRCSVHGTLPSVATGRSWTGLMHPDGIAQLASQVCQRM